MSAQNSATDRPLIWRLAIHGALMASAFAVVALLAASLDVSAAGRPPTLGAICAFVAAALVASGVWISACFAVKKARDAGRYATVLIIAFALVFRATVFLAPPVLELDLYRYLWDGFVAANRVDPFRYSPNEVAEAVRFGELESDPTLRRLADAVERRPAAQEILNLVHYPDLPTIYPPTAQALFWVAARSSGDGSTEKRIAVLKATLLACEGLTLFLVGLLLRRSRSSLAWLIVPAWSPLAVVSIANQGHMDSLPALLTTISLSAAVLGSTRGWAAVAGFSLALAVGAKVYPLNLAPLIAVFVARRSSSRGSRERCFFFVAALVATSAFVWLPFTDASRRREGFAAFAGRWEMYDAFFALVHGNLANDPTGEHPWYVVTSECFRRSIAVPELAARATSGVGIGLLALALSLRIWREPTPRRLTQDSFTLLVWFWATGPVCNPWYLLWALPLLPFTANRGWMVLFAMAPAMFLRFGLAAQWGARGEYWFDHGVVFAITGIWLIAVAVPSRANQRLESNSTGTMTLSEPDRKPSRSMDT